MYLDLFTKIFIVKINNYHNLHKLYIHVIMIKNYTVF